MPLSHLVHNGLEKVSQSIQLSRRHLFPIWVVAELHYDGNLEPTTLAEIYEDSYALLENGGPGDEQLDAFYHDVDANALFLYQSKVPDDCDKELSINDARELASALAALHGDLQNIAKLSDTRKEAVTALKTVIDSDGEIVLRGITSARWNPKHQAVVEKLIPEPLKVRVRIELKSQDDIVKEILQRDETLSGVDVEFGVFDQVREFLQFPKQNTPGLGSAFVTVISAFSLADVTLKHGMRLFDRNVRQHLGKNQVNKSIRETLEKEEGRRAFWYGHNGITIVCTRVVQKKNDDSLRSFVVTNPQIVNGCQTSHTIASSVGPATERIEPKVDFGVMARFIVLAGSEEDVQRAANDIAFKTNNQAAITSADLRSNDEVQQLFSKMLYAYGKHWFYERKRGDWDRIKIHKSKRRQYVSTDDEERRIDRDAYQQAWRAYTGLPAAAINEKGDVWKCGAPLYAQVFSANRRPCDIVMPTVLMAWLAEVLTVKNGNSLVTDIHRGMQQHLPKLRKAKMRVAAHALALFGMLVVEAYGTVEKYPETSIEKILSRTKRGKYVRNSWVTSGQNKSWGFLEDAWKLIFRAIANFITYHVDDRTTTENYTLYAALKEPGSLAKMWKGLQSDRNAESSELVKPS